MELGSIPTQEGAIICHCTPANRGIEIAKITYKSQVRGSSPRNGVTACKRTPKTCVSTTLSTFKRSLVLGLSGAFLKSIRCLLGLGSFGLLAPSPFPSVYFSPGLFIFTPRLDSWGWRYQETELSCFTLWLLHVLILYQAPYLYSSAIPGCLSGPISSRVALLFHCQIPTSVTLARTRRVYSPCEL